MGIVHFFLAERQVLFGWNRWTETPEKFFFLENLRDKEILKVMKGPITAVNRSIMADKKNQGDAL